LHRAPRRLYGDRGAAATANEGSTYRRADRHTTVADIGFDRPDKLVLGNLAAVAVPHAHAAADPSRTVPCRPDDARLRRLRLLERDPPFELRLLLEQVEQQRIVGMPSSRTSRSCSLISRRLTVRSVSSSAQSCA
jgi:hypothetical protein